MSTNRAGAAIAAASPSRKSQTQTDAPLGLLSENQRIDGVTQVVTHEEKFMVGSRGALKRN
jgi:hypothetical protein